MTIIRLEAQQKGTQTLPMQTIAPQDALRRHGDAEAVSKELVTAVDRSLERSVRARDAAGRRTEVERGKAFTGISSAHPSTRDSLISQLESDCNPEY